jgi:hypothetical protein
MPPIHSRIRKTQFADSPAPLAQQYAALGSSQTPLSDERAQAESLLAELQRPGDPTEALRAVVRLPQADLAIFVSKLIAGLGDYDTPDCLKSEGQRAALLHPLEALELLGNGLASFKEHAPALLSLLAGLAQRHNEIVNEQSDEKSKARMLRGHAVADAHQKLTRVLSRVLGEEEGQPDVRALSYGSYADILRSAINASGPFFQSGYIVELLFSMERAHGIDPLEKFSACISAVRDGRMDAQQFMALFGRQLPAIAPALLHDLITMPLDDYAYCSGRNLSSLCATLLPLCYEHALRLLEAGNPTAHYRVLKIVDQHTRSAAYFEPLSQKQVRALTLAVERFLDPEQRKAILNRAISVAAQISSRSSTLRCLKKVAAAHESAEIRAAAEEAAVLIHERRSPR